MTGNYSHHLMNYSGGPPSIPITTPQIQEMRKEAVYHLMEYLRTAQSHESSSAKDVDGIPYHLAKYMEIRSLINGTRKSAYSTAGIFLDSLPVLQ